MSTGPANSNSNYVLNLAEGLRNMGIGVEKADAVFDMEKRIKSTLKGTKKILYK